MSLKKNVIANYFGQGWSAFMGIAFLPLIIKYLGAEAYGIVGVYAMLQLWFSLLDMGMTPTLSIEMSRYTAGKHTPQSIRDLLRSLEVICILTALLIGLAVWFSSGWLATHWLRFEKLPVLDVTQAIAIMAAVLSLRFVESFYRGALVGLQKQVMLNILGAAFDTLRWGGAVCVLIWVTPSIKLFFIWQGLISLISVPLFMLVLYGSLPNANRSAKFSGQQLQGVWRFASGMMAQSLLALILTQGDKIILSRLLSLEMFGYYTLAGTVASITLKLIAPVVFALLPRFSELATKGDTTTLIRIYHQGAQLVSILSIPAALVLVFFAEPILMLWGGDPSLASHVAPLLALLAVGTMLNSLLQIPSILSIANARPGFFVRINTVAVSIFIPAIFWATAQFGAVGAAVIWLILNLGYLLVAARFFYRQFISTEMRRWYRVDILQPFISATLTAAMFGLIQPSFSSHLMEVLWILVSGFSTVVAAALSAPYIRRNLIHSR